MRYQRLIQIAGAAILVTATAAIVHNTRSPQQAGGGLGTGSAAAADDPQRHGGPPPSGQHPSGQHPSGQHPSGQHPSGQHPSGQRPSGQHPPAPPPSGHRPSGPPPSQRPAEHPRPEGTTGHRPPAAYPPVGHAPGDFHQRYGHAPDAPQHQRVYPVPGIHGYPYSRVFIPYHHYPRPYYTFYPEYWLGFGLYVGYPLAYPLWYGYPTYIYEGGTIEMLPPAARTEIYGGISFDVTPDDATVLVDGVEVGAARDFSPTEQPLTLRPGRHHIELRAPGVQPVAFDIDVVAGKVLPFAGEMR